jgi:Cu+-exporting ATPase
MSENCFHCGDEIVGKAKKAEDHSFCCHGCKSVYLLLKDNNLDSFYSLENQAGNKPGGKSGDQYRFLDVENFRVRFVEFEDDDIVKVTLFLPQIHCSSCVFLLENIAKINDNIKHVQVNFPRREASIVFSNQFPFSELAALLESIGYTPNFGDRKEQEKKLDKIFFYKIGIAGFAFGSIMLWSFPEYLGIDEHYTPFRTFTAYLSLAISIPVLLFSARDYFISAFKAIKHKNLNLDVPITLGIIALYAESSFSILKEQGPGYMDSFAGFIFFLLIGKWFQNLSYRTLSFDHDNAMYLPIAVCKIRDGKEEYIEVEKLKRGDIFVVRNEEIIPCDSIIQSDEARIDYSFVTGEAIPVKKKKNDFVYAGGKILGLPVNLSVQKESNRSHLTQLWNDVMQKNDSQKVISTQDKLSVYFLAAVLIITAISAGVWFFIDASQIVKVIVSILIVACPCALALSSPFTLGNTLQFLGKNGFYLKNTAVIEKINEITDIVFDKTGTLTSNKMDIHYEGNVLNQVQKQILAALTQPSTHPLSKALFSWLQAEEIVHSVSVSSWEEIKGAGIQAEIEGKKYRLGSKKFCGGDSENSSQTEVWFAVENEIQGRFIFQQEFRSDLKNLIESLNAYHLHVLSGDNDKDLDRLKHLFPDLTQIHFNQTPADKFNYISKLTDSGKKVMMLGDGLNDSGALGVARVGVSVSENLSQFTPRSEVILEANKLTKLYQFFSASHRAKLILKICLAFSITYNSIGLSFAISGSLTPFVAAVLMPLSSITIVFLSTFLVRILNKH